MTPTDFRSALAALGISQAAFARLTGYTAQQIGNYAAGRSEVPRHVELLLALLRLPGALEAAHAPDAQKRPWPL